MVASDAHELRASLYRTESRGNHYREDYPDSNDSEWLAWVVLQKDENDEMQLSKVMVNS